MLKNQAKNQVRYYFDLPPGPHHAGSWQRFVGLWDRDSGSPYTCNPGDEPASWVGGEPKIHSLKLTAKATEKW